MVRKLLPFPFVAAFVLILLMGCQSHRFEKGYHDWDKLQVQFYAPPGAMITVGDRACGKIKPDRSHQVGSGGDGTHKLELAPEETSTFNLGPGSYEFKYASAGWPGVSVYGELEVPRVCGLFMPGVKDMLKRCFIPIALPAPATLQAVSTRDDVFPYQSSAYRLRITNQDVERLALGDMITKVVFVADLKKAKKNVDWLEVKLTKLNGEKQRLIALLDEAKMDWLEDPHSSKFIRRQAELTRLDQEIQKKEQLKSRLEALLRADKVLLRREMLVLATDEILPVHEDPVSTASELGQVVLVMRIGGRHLHWGPAAQEAENFTP